MSALTDLFTSIANAIRNKSGETAEIPAAQFPTKISGLPAGAVTGTITASKAKSMVISGAIGKKHICVVNSPAENAITFRVLAQIAEDGSTNGVYVYNASSKPIIKNSGFSPGLWVASTGTITAVGASDETYNKQYNWIAW